MKILVDMNLSPTWVGFFEEGGFEAVHWSSIGDPRAPDAEVMSWARARQYVVFTHDLDFGAILAASGSAGPSVLQVRTQDLMPSSIGNDVLRVLRLRQEEIERGAFVTLDVARSRVRILPIEPKETGGGAG